MRSRLSERYDGEPEGESINRPVAASAILARETPARFAVALGEEFATDAWQPLPGDQRLTDRWEALPAGDRERYERRAAAWRERLAE